jgi:hypothetical protein
MIWRDKTGRLCATPPEQLVITRYMQRLYEYDSITTKPLTVNNVAARKITREDRKEK